MLKPEEITYLQTHIDNNSVDTLPEIAKRDLEQGFRDGILKDNRNFISRYSNPRYTEDFSEVERTVDMPTNPREAEDFIRRLSEDSSGLNLPVFDKYKGATVQTDKYGTPIVVTRDGESRYLNAPGFSRGDIPRMAGGALSVVEEIAPYLGGSGIIRQAPGLLAKTSTAAPGSGFRGFAQQFSPKLEVAARPTAKAAIAGQGFIGGLVETGDQLEKYDIVESIRNLEGSLIQGEEAQWERVATTPMWAMAGEAGGQLLGRAITAGFNRYLNKPSTYRVLNDDGTFTKEAVTDLKTQTKTVQELNDEVRAEIIARIKTGEATEQQLAMWERYNALDINPTRAQATRDPGDFHAQNEAWRNQDPLTRARLSDQQQTIEGQFQGRIDSARGDLNTPRQAIINKQNIFDNEVGRLYNEADEIAAGQGGFKVGDYYEWLKGQRGFDRQTNGAVDALINQINDVVAKYPGKTPAERIAAAQFDAKGVEEIRQAINRNYNGANGQARMWLNTAKEELDNTLFRNIGDEIYGESRRLYNTYSQSLRRTQVDKYDIKGRDIITDLRADDRLSNPAQLMRQVVANKAYTAKDLQQLKEFMRTGIGTADDAQIAGMGLDAWKTVRKDTLEYIMTKVQPPSNARTGGGTDLIPFDSAKMQRALDDIGWDKLKVIFSAEEVKFLRDMNLMLADMKAPTGTQASPSGPAVQLAAEVATNRFLALMAKMPSVFGQLAAGAIKSGQRQMADKAVVSGARMFVGGPSRAAQETARETARQIPQLGRTVGAGGAITGTQLGRDDG